MVAKIIRPFLFLTSLVFLMVQCGDEDSPTETAIDVVNPVLDTIPPATVNDLIAKNPTSNFIDLFWTAPGDDGTDGTASSYDVRYAGDVITEQSWGSATQADGEPAPVAGGMIQSMRVSGLDPVSTYHFAVKATDDAGNESALSNSSSITTLQESQPPSPITDLHVESIADYTYRLTWTAPGDDGLTGTASLYAIRYSTQKITVNTWPNANRINSPPSPRPGGQPETLEVTIGRTSETYYFAIKTADEVPNWSDMSNVPFAMDYGTYLFIPDTDINIGENMKVYYRAPGGQLVSVLIRSFLYPSTNCEPVHIFTKALLVPGSRKTAGIYELNYDFYDSATDEYLDPKYYYVVICLDFDLEQYVQVDFNW